MDVSDASAKSETRRIIFTATNRVVFFCNKQKVYPSLPKLLLLENVEEMSNIETLIANAVKNAEITDFIMIVRGKCYTLISVEDFIKDITFGGQTVCDTLLNCWKSMGQFDGGTNPENGDDDECSCSDDFVKIHFPKGEGIKIITSEEYTKVPDSIYIQTVGSDKYKQVVVDEEGNVREMEMPDVPDIPTVDYPVIDGESKGTGIPIYQGLNTKKIGLATISSPGGTIDVTQLPNGGISLEVPTFGVKAFYVNSGYTGTSPSDGSITRPFKNFTDARTAIIGTGNILQPQYGGAKIVLQTNSSTAQNPTVNNIEIEFQNGSALTYTGTDTYIVDSEILYSALQAGTYGLTLGANGELPINLTMKISGEGTITRTNGLGLVRWWGARRNLSNSSFNYSWLYLAYKKTDSITLREWENLASLFTVDMVDSSGTTLQSKYGVAFKATTALLPTTPLIDVRYRNVSGATPVLSLGGQLEIVSISQTHLRLRDNAPVNGGEIKYSASPYRVAYNGSTENWGSWKVYLPHTNRNVIEVEQASSLFSAIKIDEHAGFGHYGYDSILKLDGYSPFNDNTDIDIVTNAYCNQVVNAFNLSDITLAGSKGSRINVKDGRAVVNANNNASTVNVYIPNSFINIRYDMPVFINTPNYNLVTQGTMASLKGKPVFTGFTSYVNLGAAQAGELKGAIYFDTTIDAFATVS